MTKYKTTNIFEASYLLVKGCKLVGKDQKGRKATLIFNPEAEKEAFAFYNGTALVDPRRYSDLFRQIKDFIYG